MNNRVGKNTPVWMNKDNGEVTCGANIYDALRITMYGTTDVSRWEIVTEVPKDKRVLIESGYMLPKNDFNRLVLSSVDYVGDTIVDWAHRKYKIRVTYQDATKVIISSCKMISE